MKVLCKDFNYKHKTFEEVEVPAKQRFSFWKKKKGESEKPAPKYEKYRHMYTKINFIL